MPNHVCPPIPTLVASVLAMGCGTPNEGAPPQHALGPLWVEQAGTNAATADDATTRAEDASSGADETTKAFCNGSEACGGSDYCQFPDGTCGLDDIDGTCRPRTYACTRRYAPVCGCDGKTHGNRCMAQVDGVSIRHEGECDTETEVVERADTDVATADDTTTRAEDASWGADETTKTPCHDNEACGRSHYCDFPGGTCGRDDNEGMCRPRTHACTRHYAPVCGCDGKTHGNRCVAQADGVPILHEGKCATEAEMEPHDAD